MFLEDVLQENEKMQKAWKKGAEEVAKGASEYTSKAHSGFDVKPVYSPEDIKNLSYRDDIPLPGEYPYTRGYLPIHHQYLPPMMGQQIGMQSTDETNERIAFLRKLGRSTRVGVDDDTFSMMLAIDLPSQLGYDADDPLAEGKVGECAMSICTMNDYVELFKNLPAIRNTPTLFVAFNACEWLVAAAAVYCIDYRKDPLSDLRVYSNDDHICQHYYDIYTYPPRIGLRMRVEFTKFIVDNCPRSAASVLESYSVAEAGADPAFEIGITLAQAIETAEACVNAGLDPNDFMGKFRTHTRLGMNLFEEVAKQRALRKIWAKISKERFGCTRPEAFKLMEYSTQCAAMDAVALEPLNNIIRITIQTLVAFLSDLDAVAPISYDEPLGIPSAEAAMISLRTVQILSEETGIRNVTDPLGGSYYIESLTNKMEEEINNWIKEIEKRGGFVKALESGWMKAAIAKQAYEHQQKLASGEKIKIGFNKYKTQDRPPAMNVVRRPIEVEEKCIRRAKEYKASRDQDKVKRALSKVKKACEAMDKDWPNSVGGYIPTLMDAIRAKATLGECCKINRDVFGFGFWAK